jgi:hypothetical protein
MKRIVDKRRKQRGKTTKELRTTLLDSLARIAEGLTPPEIVDAHLDFYDMCDPLSQQVLLKIFSQQETVIQDEICIHFAEKHYV